MDSPGNEGCWLFSIVTVFFFLVPVDFICIITHIKIPKYIESMYTNVIDMN